MDQTGDMGYTKTDHYERIIRRPESPHLRGFETVKWQAAPEVDEDLIEGRDYIRGDNDVAARAFLDTAFETFDLLGDFPEMGPRARLRSKKPRELRYFVMPPPFNRWIIFSASRITGLESSAYCTAT